MIDNSAGGFSIVELILVLAIMGTLSIAILVGFGSSINRSARGVEIDSFGRLFDQYRGASSSTRTASTSLAGDTCGYSGGLKVQGCIALGFFLKFGEDEDEADTITVHPVYGKNTGTTSLQLFEYDPYIPSASNGSLVKADDIQLNEIKILTRAKSGDTRTEILIHGGGENPYTNPAYGRVEGIGYTTVDTKTGVDIDDTDPYTGSVAGSRGKMFVVMDQLGTTQSLSSSIDGDYVLAHGSEVSGHLCALSSDYDRRMTIAYGRYDNQVLITDESC